MYTLPLGLEHLQTGVELDGKGPICFEADGPTTFIAWSLLPFRAKWTLADRPPTVLHSSLNLRYQPPTPETLDMVRERVEHNYALIRSVDRTIGVKPDRTKANVWHLVTAADQQRITCGESRIVETCAKPATCCEHCENSVSISFHYYCEEHGRAHGFNPVHCH